MIPIPKLKDFLCEMAYNRSKLKDRIRNLTPVINDHLIKILRWKDPRNYQKHLKDLDIWLEQIGEMKLKGKKDRLKASEYFDLLFQEPFTSSNDPQDVEDFRKILTDSRRFESYRKLPVLKSATDVLYMIEQFHSWVSEKLEDGDIYRLATRYFKENMK